MKTINKRLIGLFVLTLIQLVFPLYFIIEKENIIKKGNEYVFQIRPVDPYDFFQGKYVSLNVNSIKVPSSKVLNFEKNDIIFVEFKKDSLGSTIKSISKNKTKKSLKLKLNSDPSEFDYVLIHLPFKRFYLEEYNAKHVEKKLERSQSNNNFVHVKILNGDFVITDISSDGKSLVNGKKVSE
jgi:uncharacterized membrane-anchored protein